MIEVNYLKNAQQDYVVHYIAVLNYSICLNLCYVCYIRMFVMAMSKILHCVFSWKAYYSKMFYPDYVWIFFNWYLDDWWLAESSCTKNGKVSSKNLERLVKTSLVLDHYPRIEDKDANKSNVGNIVSYGVH